MTKHKIGNRTVTIGYSKTKEIDWEAIAAAIAQAYLKQRCMGIEEKRTDPKTG